MSKAKTIAITFGFAATVLVCTASRAGETASEVPEMACWGDEGVAPEIKRDTLGFVELGTRPKGTREVGAYVRTGDGWELHRMLNLLEETLPLVSTNCMRAPAWGYAAGGHYPIVQVRDHHIRVVIDPVQDWRVWLDRRELEKEFFVTVRMGTRSCAPLADLIRKKASSRNKADR